MPVQEMIARSGLQAPLESLIEGPRRSLQANVVASLLFAATHLHLSPALALAVLPFGLYWGILFQRQRSLLGVPPLRHHGLHRSEYANSVSRDQSVRWNQ